MSAKTIEWIGGTDGHVALIDQTLLPGELRVVECHDVETVREAICSLRVRGAPAIGIAAALGLVVGIGPAADADELDRLFNESYERLASARPTAVNLRWALERMRRTYEAVQDSPAGKVKSALLAEAQAIRDEDAAMCRAIGAAGQHLITEGAGVLTHCNAGGLATAEYGTALAVMYAAHERGRKFRVFADETRPLLQGARLTSWELQQAGIDVTVICDNMAGLVMKEGKVKLVITGADRIAANGDAANKIGTYSVAVLAKAHGIPFYVAAPGSTFDFGTPSGKGIPIEQRSDEEVRRGFGRTTVPEGVPCYCPAFDVTPAELIAGLITDRGLIQPVSRQRIDEVLRPEVSAAGK
jgi:methylthioribose-1-phosphate isomerase